ncbi:MAG: NTP transferase domain-containing protein [Muribaculaceae bacterium]|nr:NTP transferase domain-containing protein [Muribaculaceae bacterium]
MDFGIIAAGDGNRIKEEGSYLPKPLVEIEGQPMIGRLISLMEDCGANSVSVIVNSDMPEVWDYLQNLVPQSHCELKMISKKTPSSMHSFYELLNVMKPVDKFIITTVDTIFRSEDFKRYAQYFQNSPKDIDGVMGVTSYIDDEKPLYVETDNENRITAYLDSPVSRIDNPESKVQYISGGIYGLRHSAIPVLQNCIDNGVNRMRNFQRKLVEEGLNLKAYDLGKVLDVDHLTDIQKANSFLASKP